MIDDKIFTQLFNDLNVKCNRCDYLYKYNIYEYYNKYSPDILNYYYKDECKCKLTNILIGDSLKFFDYNIFNLDINDVLYQVKYDILNSISVALTNKNQINKNINQLTPQQLAVSILFPKKEDFKTIYLGDYCTINKSIDEIKLKISKRINLE